MTEQAKEDPLGPLSTGYQIRNQEAIHFLTFTVVNWIDVFTRKEHRDTVIENLKYCQQRKGLVIYGYVIMSNHLHLIARAKAGNLSDIIRDFKSYTGKAIIKAIQTEPESRRLKQQYKFWKDGNHPVELDLPYLLDQKLDYIHHNPVKAGIVANPEDYLYSSARDYAGEQGLLQIELIQ